MMTTRRLSFFLLLATIMTGCGVGLAEGDEELTRGAASNLEFARDVKVGDIILTSTNAERGCWYLNDAQNWYTDPRYCHAALVVERVGETGITTIEALNPSQNIQVLTDREQDLEGYLETKLAILRVKGKDGQPLSEATIQKVIEKALSWRDVKYVEPPISLSGDPKETGLYCSMLPYRAYLDAARINLDSISIPFFVTPDELYASKRVEVVFESSPQDPPTR